MIKAVVEKVTQAVTKKVKMTIHHVLTADFIHPCGSKKTTKTSEEESYVVLGEEGKSRTILVLGGEEPCNDGTVVKETKEVKESGIVSEQLVKDNTKLNLKEALADAEIRAAKPNSPRWETLQRRANRIAARCQRNVVSTFVREKFAALRQVFTRETEEKEENAEE